MWLAVLGPLQACQGNVPLAIPGGKQRVILATLIMRAGETVSYDELAEVVWDGRPPESARVTIRNYVKRLRRCLGDEAAALIATRYPGYLLQAGENEVDALAFARGCRDGAAAARSGDWEGAFGLHGQALALWRGLPLHDVPSDQLQAEHGPRLERLRLLAVEERMEAGLQLGRHRQLLAELRDVAAAEPLRERVQG
ncbi:MAG: AfsR/SARP family transcriptional regulator, partial [Solirubrobacteraceae bacterium]